MYTITYSHSTERSKTVPVTKGMIASALLLSTLGMATAIGGLAFFVLKIAPTL